MHDTQPVALGPTVSMGARLAGFGPATRDSIDAGFAALGERDYHPGLPTSRLIAEVRRLLATERRAERLVCRYLADLADRVQARQDAELDVYADEFHAARSCFDLGARETRERIRIGRALRHLRQIERAFIDGELSYSRVREVTRVATVHTEADWLELAQSLDMRSLERRVATDREATGAKSDGRGERRVDEPARTERTGPGTVRVTFELSSEAWTVLGRAMREARRAGAIGLSDGEALEAVARAALSIQTQGANASDAAALPTRATQLGSAPALPTRATQLGSAPALPTRATQLGSAPALPTRATQLGSAPALGPGQTSGATALEVGPDRTRDVRSGDPAEQWFDEERSGIASGQQALPCEPAVRLIHVMGHGRGWTLDALTEASGLSAQAVSVALTLLELGGRVRRRAFVFDPV